MSSPDHRTRASTTTVAGAAMLGALAMGSHLLPALSIYWPALGGVLGVQTRTATGRGYALTFDDGPHPRGTPAVLEILAAASVQATFFVVGEQVRRNPALVDEILAGGHQVALHCDRHRNLLRLTPWQARADIERARETIESVAARPIELYRPPYGALSAVALRVARTHDWRTVLWSQWGKDWQAEATPASIAARVTDGVRDGSVLLLHDADDYSAPDSWRRTVAALPRVLDALAQRGLHPVAP